jgi:hypothetical protein
MRGAVATENTAPTARVYAWLAATMQDGANDAVMMRAAE